MIDDDPALTHLLAVILVRIGGYDVREENRPYAALETARSYRPHLILLDVDMPGKDGGAVAAEIAGDALLANIPIIFVTSLISKAEAECRKGQRYISKPVDPSELLDAVHQLCLCPRSARVAA